MTSWVTLARPFARRRAIYRKNADERQRVHFENPTDDPVEEEWRNGRVEISMTCAEAIEWMWSDLVNHMKEGGYGA